MKPLNTSVNDDLHKQIKMLAVSKDKTIQELVDEALKDLLTKYGINYERSNMSNL